MDVFGTESIGKVDESGIDHDSLFTSVQEILQVPKVAVAAADPVTRTVLFQHKHLTGREPPQGGEGVFEPPLQGQVLQVGKEVVVVKDDGVGRYELLHAVFACTVGVG